MNSHRWCWNDGCQSARRNTHIDQAVVWRPVFLGKVSNPGMWHHILGSESQRM
ncbi:hypothetical protein B0H19DRAFT_540966 [Mycena capillaripes]|nr:hypothetical protein B0H19DRAFT_704920 [Mycena capillaripes]KAJ6527803.1 hypothetical protein B0H19DRAFT_540966 [Mycena capillaripes]